MNGYHIPVLLNEVVTALEVKPGEKYIDCTYGGGGHFRGIQKLGGIVLGIDQDPEAHAPVRGNFAHLKEIADMAGFHPVSGVLFDLGVSSHQLETPERGFSFKRGGLLKLDMRMDPTTQTVTAADLINAGSEKELANLFFKYGEERFAKAIAREIKKTKIETTDELARAILRVRKRGKNDRTHPATRVFQALRIAVNDELNSLEAALPQAWGLLKPGGKLVVISFHSLEDRIVKKFMSKSQLIRPSLEEIKINPRARSGKLRVMEKI